MSEAFLTFARVALLCLDKPSPLCLGFISAVAESPPHSPAQDRAPSHPRVPNTSQQPCE